MTNSTSNNNFVEAVDYSIKKYNESTINLERNKRYSDTLLHSIISLNIHTGRPEFSNVYQNNEYYCLFFSNLLEAFHQFSLGYMKNTIFLLRAAVEDFSKFLASHWGLSINASSFKKNINAIEKFFKADKTVKITHSDQQLLTKHYFCNLQNLYSVLSQTTHSLKLGVTYLNFIQALDEISKKYMDSIFENFQAFLNNIHSITIILSSFSFLRWDTQQLTYLLEIIWKNNEENIDIWLKRIKDKEDGSPFLFCIPKVDNNSLTKKI